MEALEGLISRGSFAEDLDGGGKGGRGENETSVEEEVQGIEGSEGRGVEETRGRGDEGRVVDLTQLSGAMVQRRWLRRPNTWDENTAPNRLSTTPSPIAHRPASLSPREPSWQPADRGSRP